MSKNKSNSALSTVAPALLILGGLAVAAVMLVMSLGARKGDEVAQSKKKASEIQSVVQSIAQKSENHTLPSIPQVQSRTAGSTARLGSPFSAEELNPPYPVRFVPPSAPEGVKKENGGGGEVEVKEAEMVLPPPGAIQVVADSDRMAVFVSWMTPKVGTSEELPADLAYVVFRQDSASDGTPMGRLNPVSGAKPLSERSFIDYGAEPGKPYFYSVAAVTAEAIKGLDTRLVAGLNATKRVLASEPAKLEIGPAQWWITEDGAPQRSKSGETEGQMVINVALRQWFSVKPAGQERHTFRITAVKHDIGYEGRLEASVYAPTIVDGSAEDLTAKFEIWRDGEWKDFTETMMKVDLLRAKERTISTGIQYLRFDTRTSVITFVKDEGDGKTSRFEHEVSAIKGEKELPAVPEPVQDE